MFDYKQLTIDHSRPGLWAITFCNPPINMFLPTTIVELGALMTDLESDPSVKVVEFQSANPDFFIAHLDVTKAAERPEVLGLWRDFVLRLSSTPVVSIAKIRGRTRGIGNEFVLACDMRFASRQSALFGNPEVGVGLVPGGGALEWLPRFVGRSPGVWPRSTGKRCPRRRPRSIGSGRRPLPSFSRATTCSSHCWPCQARR